MSIDIKYQRPPDSIELVISDETRRGLLKHWFVGTIVLVIVGVVLARYIFWSGTPAGDTAEFVARSGLVFAFFLLLAYYVVTWFKILTYRYSTIFLLSGSGITRLDLGRQAVHQNWADVIALSPRRRILYFRDSTHWNLRYGPRAELSKQDIGSIIALSNSNPLIKNAFDEYDVSAPSPTVGSVIQITMVASFIFGGLAINKAFRSSELPISPYLIGVFIVLINGVLYFFANRKRFFVDRKWRRILLSNNK